MIDWKLNGTALCPWNFTFSEAPEVIGDDVRLLDGGLRREIRARKFSGEFAWEFLPEHFDGTYHAYRDLESLGTRSGTMSLVRPTGTSGTTGYRVFLSPPDAKLSLRTDGTIFWDVATVVREA